MSDGSLHLRAHAAHALRRRLAIAGAGILAVLIGSAVFTARAAAPAVSGYMLEPYAGQVFSGDPTSAPIHFEGFLSMPPNTEAGVAIDVMPAPDADPTIEANWKYNVAIAQPIPFRGDSYFWSVDAKVFTRQSWPSGGLGRVRAVWVKPKCDRTPKTKSVCWDVLTAEDVMTTPLLITHALVTDSDPTPTDRLRPPNYLSALDNKPGFPHFDVLNSNLTTRGNEKRKQENETKRYYANIGTEPPYDIRHSPSVFTTIKTLADFQKRYFTTPGQVEYVAKYYNRGDLGIGREMHCVFGPESACYVTNYAPRDANDRVIFGDREGSLAALTLGKEKAKKQAFATVAMVERGGMARHAPNKVFFVVYDQDGKLKTDDAQLDSQGYNTFIPGNCMVCHGGSGSYNTTTHAATDAYFLPFDVAAFDFASSDPGHPLSRQAQHDTFRAMNREIYFTTDTGLLPNADIIKHWYQNDFNAGQFDSDAIPPFSSWNFGASRQRLYRRVFATGCRTCHISHTFDGAFSFFYYPDFEANKGLINSVVCGSHRMPNAEQTLREFWRGDGRAHLLGHLPGLTGACRP
jgi:hypothetical protein